MGRDFRGDRAGGRRGAGGGGEDRFGRHHVAAAAGNGGVRGRSAGTLQRRYRHFHHPRIPLQDRGPSADQLPPAALHPVYAGFGLCRTGAHARRLCPCHILGLQVLFVWRHFIDRESAMTATGLGFDVHATDGAARRGRLTTAHGTVETPAFMPVGTVGTVKGMMPESVRATGAEILLGNTYHLMLRPTAERVAQLGGLHRFMNWSGPILTDSGGFQVMSLAERRKLTEEGVVFSSHHDGSRHELTPERSVEIQHQLDATITMVLDECIALPAPEAEVARAMELSLRWAARSKAAFVARPGYGLFGIVQGGTDLPQRARSARGLVEIGFDGYAIGGLAVGEPQEL